MRKILILALREYKTAVRTKSFIIGLVVAPILMSGGFLAIILSKNKVNVDDKKIIIIDHTNTIAQTIIDAAEQRNNNEIIDKGSGKKVKPAYIFESIDPDAGNLFQQKLDLSSQVRNKQIHAFIEIGPEVVHPGETPDKSKIKYYSENSFMDEIRGWINYR